MLPVSTSNSTSTPTLQHEASGELTLKLEALQRQLDAERIDKERLASQLQDAKSKARTAPIAPPPAAQRSGASQTQTREQQLMEYANAQAREVERLRTAMKYNLKPEDLEGDFQTPMELELHAQVRNLEKQISNSALALEATNVALKKLADTQTVVVQPEGLPDGGGPVAVSKSRAEKIQNLRTRAQEVTGKPEAAWLVLQAIHQDPTKIMTRIASEDEGE